MKNNCIFHGYILQEDLFRLYSNCDVFLFPSLGDGFGFVVIEAMAAGMPIICSKNSVGSDAIRDYENGFTFQAGDNDEMIKRILYFVENRFEVERMGLKSAEIAKEYTWEAYDEAVKGFLRKVIQRS